MEIVMRTPRIALLTGTAALALVGLAGMAAAQPPDSAHGIHVLTIRLPDGRIEQIRYTGDVPPTVSLAPDMAQAAFAPESVFTMMDRMSAAMDRQAAAMFQALDTMPTMGAEGIVPAVSEPGICSRSIQITFTGNGQAPHVVSQTAGDCGPATGGSAVPAALPNAPEQQHTPAVIMARAETPERRD
jgi:hypothetical protein